jgi:hypothetical protein
MKDFYKFAITAAFVLAGSAVQADRKQDAFYMLLDNTSDNPLLTKDLQIPLLDMLLADANERGLGLADAVILRADRSVGAWNEDILTSRSQPPEELRDLLVEKLAQVPGETETSGLMRLLQTSRIDCSAGETATVYVVTNLVSSITLDAEEGADLETAPSVSLSGCDLVWVGPTLGSPGLSLREVQHVDALITNLSTHMEADGYVILR